MKLTKNIFAGSIAGTVMALSAIAPVANAEVSASVGVASTYLWRGQDLGTGTPAVSGDLTYSNSGFYTGIWVSSGDTTLGTEYDLYAGYGTAIGGLSVDLSVWTYINPNSPTFNDAGSPITIDENGDAIIDQRDTFGDATDAILGLGYGPVSFTWINTTTVSEVDYFALGYSLDAFSLTYGFFVGDNANEYSHLDLTYSYNDNLAFTFSQVVDDNDDAIDDDLKFVVSYSIPLE